MNAPVYLHAYNFTKIYWLPFLPKRKLANINKLSHSNFTAHIVLCFYSILWFLSVDVFEISLLTIYFRSHSDNASLVGLFGLHLLPSTRSRIVITNCEFDAMIIHQATSKFAVTLLDSACHIPQHVSIRSVVPFQW